MNDEARTRWLDTVVRHRRDPVRPANDSYWAPRLDCASRDELAAIQSDKLVAAVAYAHATIPFYRRKFDAIGLAPGDIRGIEDLARIPITTKHELAADLEANPPWGTYTAVDDRIWLERGWQVFTTSGTTARPRPFRYTSFDREMWAWRNARAMWAMGFRPGRDAAMLAFGYGPHVWLWGVHHAFALMGIPIVTGGGLDSRTRARFIRDFAPTILCCTPSYAIYLADVMRQSGIDPAATAVRYLFCGGEPGFSVAATRRRLEQTWNAELHEFYGCTEASPSAGGYTCSSVARRKDGPVSVHLLEDQQLWETIDPVSLDPVPASERGLTVVTELGSEASPQIRFLVGDYTTLGYDRCECGRTHMRATGGFLGRADDMLNIRGVTLFPSSIEDAIRSVAEAGDEFEIVISTGRALDVMTVRIEPRAEIGADRHAELARRIESEIVARCELHPVVEVVALGTLPRTETKARRVRDLRPTPERS